MKTLIFVLTGVLAIGSLPLARAFSSKAPAPSKSAEPDLVWISKSDGSLQCEQGSGKKLETARAELEKSGVKVVEALSGNDGGMRIQLCGSPTGGQHEFRIARGDLEKALKLGFVLGLGDGHPADHKH
jgi:hypothetical protein